MRQIVSYRNIFVENGKGLLFLFILEGAVFQKKVWDVFCQIPYGETRSYGEIATMIESPKKASHAMGGANNQDLVMILVFCHRVIGADGTLVGYGGGLSAKEYLLSLEKGEKTF